MHNVFPYMKKISTFQLYMYNFNIFYAIPGCNVIMAWIRVSARELLLTDYFELLNQLRLFLAIFARFDLQLHLYFDSSARSAYECDHQYMLYVYSRCHNNLELRRQTVNNLCIN